MERRLILAVEKSDRWLRRTDFQVAAVAAEDAQPRAAYSLEDHGRYRLADDPDCREPFSARRVGLLGRRDRQHAAEAAQWRPGLRL